jgi:hypothetical protein
MTGQADDVAGVRVEHIERVFWLLREKFPRVLEANRYFEEETGLHNEAGQNNIVDAFSHLATLVENAPELSPEEQRDQVTHLEDHLRRSMMEAFEQVVKERLGLLARLWDEHVKIAGPLLTRGELRGVAGYDELWRLRRRLAGHLDKGRASKRAVNWDSWEQGTDELVQACAIADDLHGKLEQGIAAAVAYDETKTGLRLGRVGIVVTIVISFVCLALGYLIGQL